MKSTQTGSTSAAIELDRSALEKVERIAEWVQEQNRHEILSRFKVTPEEVGLAEVPYDNARYRDITYAQLELKPLDTLSIDWEYEDNRSYEVDNFAALYRSLDEEPGELSGISINTAFVQYGRMDISFSSSRYGSTAKFKVTGEQHVVEAAHQRLQRILADISVSHAILYGQTPSLVIRLGFGLAVLIGLAALLPTLSGSFGSNVARSRGQRLTW